MALLLHTFDDTSKDRLYIQTLVTHAPQLRSGAAPEDQIQNAKRGTNVLARHVSATLARLSPHSIFCIVTQYYLY